MFHQACGPGAKGILAAVVCRRSCEAPGGTVASFKSLFPPVTSLDTKKARFLGPPRSCHEVAGLATAGRETLVGFERRWLEWHLTGEAQAPASRTGTKARHHDGRVRH